MFFNPTNKVVWTLRENRDRTRKRKKMFVFMPTDKVLNILSPRA